MKTVAIIQARVASSRLPGKVLLPAAGKPMLAHMIGRLKHCTLLNEIVVATSSEPGNSELVRLAAAEGVFGFVAPNRSEDDVLGRVADAAFSFEADVVVDLTGDCPLIDPRLVDDAVNIFQHASQREAWNYTLISNGIERTYPDGMDIAVFANETLQRADEGASDPYEREHVTAWISANAEPEEILHLWAPSIHHWPELGLTLDELDDYALLRRIIEHFDPRDDYSLTEILDLLRNEHPEWLELNMDVKRNPVRR